MADEKIIFKCKGEDGDEYWKSTQGGYQLLQIREGVAKALKRAGYKIRELDETTI